MALGAGARFALLAAAIPVLLSLASAMRDTLDSNSVVAEWQEKSVDMSVDNELLREKLLWWWKWFQQGQDIELPAPAGVEDWKMYEMPGTPGEYYFYSAQRGLRYDPVADAFSDSGIAIADVANGRKPRLSSSSSSVDSVDVGDRAPATEHHMPAGRQRRLSSSVDSEDVGDRAGRRSAGQSVSMHVEHRPMDQPMDPATLHHQPAGTQQQLQQSWELQHHLQQVPEPPRQMYEVTSNPGKYYFNSAQGSLRYDDPVAGADSGNAWPYQQPLHHAIQGPPSINAQPYQHHLPGQALDGPPRGWEYRTWQGGLVYYNPKTKIAWQPPKKEKGWQLRQGDDPNMFYNFNLFSGEVRHPQVHVFKHGHEDTAPRVS